MTKVTISSSRPFLSVTALLDESAPTVTSGYGGWQDIMRPRQKALTEWQGAPLVRLSLGVLLDAWDSNGNIESDCRVMERLSSSSNGEQPPIIDIAGPVPHATDFQWVVESLDWGDSIWDGDVRKRQSISLALVEFVADKLVVEQQVIKPGAYRLYTVKHGDTLAKIAKTFAPKKSSAKQILSFLKHIQKLNGIRDPKHIGGFRVLRIPY